MIDRRMALAGLGAIVLTLILDPYVQIDPSAREIDHNATPFKDVSTEQNVVRLTEAGQDCEVRLDFSASWHEDTRSAYRDILGFKPSRVLFPGAGLSKPQTLE